MRPALPKARVPFGGNPSPPIVAKLWRTVSSQPFFVRVSRYAAPKRKRRHARSYCRVGFREQQLLPSVSRHRYRRRQSCEESFPSTCLPETAKVQIPIPVRDSHPAPQRRTDFLSYRTRPPSDICRPLHLGECVEKRLSPLALGGGRKFKRDSVAIDDRVLRNAV